MFEKILVLVDDSRQSRKAFWYALEIACRFGAELHAVSVNHRPESADRANGQGRVDGAEPRPALDLKKLTDIAAVEGLTVTSEEVAGTPTEHLVALAEERGADFIVIAWPDSSSEYVLRDAHCPILVVC